MMMARFIFTWSEDVFKGWTAESVLMRFIIESSLYKILSHGSIQIDIDTWYRSRSVHE